MSKTVFIVSLLLLLVSCQEQPHCESNGTPDSAQKMLATSDCGVAENSQTTTDAEGEDEEDWPEVGSVPPEAELFDADAVLTNFDKNDEVKLLSALEIIKKVIRTQEFKNRVINFTYNGKREFVDNRGLSNAEIYQKLLDASEDLRPGVDHQMDLELELYYSTRNTVGYTYPNVLRIWMNTKYFDVYTPAEVAGNVFHEWTHKLGFEHDSQYSPSRDYTVPYALGYLIEELGKKFE